MRLLIPMFLVALLAAPASGAGLDLTWNACATDGGASNVTFDCASPSAVYTLFLVFTSPAPVQQLAGLGGILNLQSDVDPLPDFWNLQDPVVNVGGCNPGWAASEVRPPVECAGAVAAPSRYPPGAQYEVVVATYTTPWSGSPSRARMLFYATRGNAINDPFPIAVGTPYFASRIDFFMATSSSAGGPCAGCESPMVIVWDDLAIDAYDSGAEAVTVHVSGPGFVSNCATTGDPSIPCGGTAAERSTWGRLKSLYR